MIKLKFIINLVDTVIHVARLIKSELKKKDLEGSDINETSYAKLTDSVAGLITYQVASDRLVFVFFLE